MTARTTILSTLGGVLITVCSHGAAFGESPAGPPPGSYSKSDITLAFALAQSGDVERLAQLLKAHPGLVNAKGPLGDTALSYAAYYNQVESAKLLLKHGATWTEPDNLAQETPVHMAAKKDAVEVLELLLDAGADINTLSAGQKKSSSQPFPEPYLSPLNVAAAAGSEKTVKRLLERGAKLDVNPVESAFPAIHSAVTGRNVLGYGDPKGITDVAARAAPDNHIVIELLLAHGATLKDQNYRGFTPLHWGVECGSHEIVEYLLTAHSEDVDVNAFNRDGFSPLHTMSQRTFIRSPENPEPEVRMIKLLRKHGADPNARCGFPGAIQKTPLERAQRDTRRYSEEQRVRHQKILEALSPLKAPEKLGRPINSLSGVTSQTHSRNTSMICL